MCLPQVKRKRSRTLTVNKYIFVFLPDQWLLLYRSCVSNDMDSLRTMRIRGVAILDNDIMAWRPAAKAVIRKGESKTARFSAGMKFSCSGLYMDRLC